MNATAAPSLRRLRVTLAGLALAAAALAQAPAQAALSFTLELVDPNGAAASFKDQIHSHVAAALFHWGQHIDASATISVQFHVTDAVERAAGASASSAWVGFDGARHVYDQGLSHKLRTGIDANGAAPDVLLFFSPTYLSTELWFDADPFARSAPVAADRTDAVSIFIHEFGHALGYNGWGDLTTGALPAGYASTWDTLTRWDGQTLWFTGAQAMQVYGGAVPLTAGNNFHVGNAWGAGSDLLSDVMNGVTMQRGTRYQIGALNVAMLSDLGLPMVMVVPEPAQWALLSSGLLVLGWLQRRRRTLPVR
jgi:hypothetical protein